MNSMLYKSTGGPRASQSLMNLNEWQEKEKNALNCAVDEEGILLDNLTLELRVHPPEVHIDNIGDAKHTIVTIDSANRPGSLVFVVQHLTELGLRVHSARISSDGGWFHDMFAISEADGSKVKNQSKLMSIKQMLNIYMQTEDVIANGDTTDDAAKVETTVFEVSGVDRPGLMADSMQLMTQNGCDVRSAAIWTYRKRVAIVFSVTEKGRAIPDAAKTKRLEEMMEDILRSDQGSMHVKAHNRRGTVHHDRRLHQLMLQDDVDDWKKARVTELYQNSSLHGQRTEIKAYASRQNSVCSERNGVSTPSGSEASYRSPKYDHPSIDISYCSNYWTVNIKCRDRAKLLLDTVCTLNDMNFDIYHATIDADAEGVAHQEYFVRPRAGDGEFNDEDALLVKAMLNAAIERRFPRGIKVQIRSMDRFGCMALLTRRLFNAGLTVTRAKVRTYATSNSSGHTLYIMNSDGEPPSNEAIERALLDCGGLLSTSVDGSTSNTPLVDTHPFSFKFLQREGSHQFGGSPDSGNLANLANYDRMATFIPNSF
jgi:glycine cleavage system regulatory protein